MSYISAMWNTIFELRWWNQHIISQDIGISEAYALTEGYSVEAQNTLTYQFGISTYSLYSTTLFLFCFWGLSIPKMEWKRVRIRKSEREEEIREIKVERRHFFLFVRLFLKSQQLQELGHISRVKKFHEVSHRNGGNLYK